MKIFVRIINFLIIDYLIYSKMNKLFKFRNNKLSLIKNTDNGNNNLTYNVIIEKGV